MAKRNIINVEGTPINITSIKDEDYISLTDMAGGKDDGSRAADVIKNWIRNRATIEFLGTWETMYNPNFKVVEFDHFKKDAGLPTFTMSVSNWVDNTNAKGIFSVKGRYGGTYAHKDIAFEFGSAISPVFKLYIIKEYQRLKEIDSNEHNLEWNVKRILSKVNYHIHTDAVKNHILPSSKFSKDKQWIEYANEADILNVALFGCTAKEWREANPSLSLQGNNMRDFASINELAVLSNLESFSSEMIKNGTEKNTRFKYLCKAAKEQLEVLNSKDIIKSIKKESDTTYIEAKENISNFDKSLKKGLDYNPKEEN